MGRYHSGNTVVTFEDSVGASLTIGPGEGNFTFSETNAAFKDVVNKQDRGSHDGWVETVDKLLSWSITVDLKNESQTEAASARIQDWLLKRNNYSSLSSVSSDTWAFKIIVTMNDGVTTAVTTMPECVSVYAFAEGVEGHTLALSGECAQQITQT